MTELATRIIPRLSADERRVMAMPTVQLAMLGGYKGITIEQHDKVPSNTIKSLIARGLARAKIDSRSRVMPLSSLGAQVNAALSAIADRNGNRQDGETRLGPKDESGGAEGNRTRNAA